MLAKSDATGRVMSTFWQDKIKFAEPEKDCHTVSERQGLKAMKDSRRSGVHLRNL